MADRTGRPVTADGGSSMDDQIILARLDAPDLAVRFGMDGGIQGLIQRKRED